MEEKILAGKYGSYELVYASEQAIEKYAEACFESIGEDEIYEAWQLHHLSVLSLLDKVFASAESGRTEAYFLLCHNSGEEKTEVIGIGGFAPLAEAEMRADAGAGIVLDTANVMGGKAGEIWFMGQDLAGHKRFLVRYGKEIIAKILTVYPTLFNAAPAWNKSALKLVKFLGFTVEEKAICAGLDNALFKYFYLTKK